MPLILLKREHVRTAQARNGDLMAVTMTSYLRLFRAFELWTGGIRRNAENAGKGSFLVGRGLSEGTLGIRPERCYGSSVSYESAGPSSEPQITIGDSVMTTNSHGFLISIH